MTPTTSEKTGARFVYLERTSSPAEVTFIPSGHGHNSDQALFKTRLPIGFVNRLTNDLVLLDVELGCVYRIAVESTGGQVLEHSKVVTRTRINYAFEEVWMRILEEHRCPLDIVQPYL